MVFLLTRLAPLITLNCFFAIKNYISYNLTYIIFKDTKQVLA